ncbi:MAG: protein kinase [Holophagae bacterium]|jgi:non-specific serine/threonine protein kinase
MTHFPGSRLGHYRIVEKVGEGGMGVVYEAEDTRLGRRVAVKLLQEELGGGEEPVERLRREAQAASALNHPHICTIHEIGEHDGRPFVVMELLQGRSLDRLVAAGPLDTERLVRIADQVADALEAAHAAGIVHRDLKPANVFITRRGDAKLLDFGLAKRGGGSPGAHGRTGLPTVSVPLTLAGTVLGTAAYMSPEQARGRVVDARSDIFSLGVVLYEMATGKLPFPGDTMADAFAAILDREPEKPSIVNPSLPTGLDSVIGKALAKDPDHRYQSAAELRADLRSLLGDASAVGLTDSGQQPWTHRLRRRVLGAAGAAALAVLAVAGTLWVRHRPEPDPDAAVKRIAVLPFENLGATEDEYFADGITEEITSRLAGLQGLGVTSRTSAVGYKGKDKSAPEVGRELGVEYVLEGAVRWERGGEGEGRVRVTPQLIRVADDEQVWGERYDSNLESVLDIQSEIAERIVRELNVAVSSEEKARIRQRPTENLVAYQAYLRALQTMVYSHPAEEDMERAVKLLGQAVALDPEFALAWVRLSDAQRNLYFYGYDRSQERLDASWRAVQRARQLAPELPAVQVALGYYSYHGLLDYERALAELSRAAADLPHNADLLAAIAWIWRRQGLFDESIANLEQAMALSPRDANLIMELAYTYLVVGDYDRALELCDRSIAIGPEQRWGYLVKVLALWAKDVNLAEARATLERMPDQRSEYPAVIWFGQEMLEGDCQAALDRASNLPSEMLWMQSSVAPRSSLMGSALRCLGDQQPAREEFRSAARLLEEELEHHPDDPRLHSALGLAYAGLGRAEDAIQHGRRAVELYPVSKDALLGTDRLWDLIRILVRTGEHDEALDLLASLLSIPSRYSRELLRAEPALAPLRTHPRFRGLVGPPD